MNTITFLGVECTKKQYDSALDFCEHSQHGEYMRYRQFILFHINNNVNKPDYFAAYADNCDNYWRI